MFLAIIYFYFAICFAILFYTFGFIYYQSYDKNRQIKLVYRYRKMVKEQLNSMKENYFVDRNHLGKLKKQLSNINNLIAYEKALSKLENSEELDDYLAQLERTIKQLVIAYKSHNQMEQAYLARFIATYAAKGKWHNPFIYKTLVSYLDHATIYLRESVLLATYQQPNPNWITYVFHYLTKNDLFHHPKLIQDGLLTYPYDSDELIEELWFQRESFEQPIVLGLIGYITFKSERFKETFYDLLLNNNIELEVKIRLIRYFKKHYYPKIESLLLEFSKDDQDEIRIVTVQVLSAYNSDQVKNRLKEALTDSNYYVRRNASQSLLEMGISEYDLQDILLGQDKYAKEMLAYHLSKKGGKTYEFVH